MKANYYEILGVERSASEADIRERFRKLAREKHPDRFSGVIKEEAERKFQTLTEAMNVLTNPARRRQHDSEIAAGAPKAASDLGQVAKVYMSKGAKAFKESDFPAAYENFDMAAKHNPQDSRAFHYLALAAIRIPGYTRQSMQAIETAIQREPYNPVYLKDAGLICRRAGLTSKAERYFEEALKWGKENPEVEAALFELRQSRDVKEPSKSGGLLDSLFKKGS